MVHSWNASSEAAELYDGGVTYNVQLLAYYAVLLLIVVASSAVRAARVRCCLHRRIGPASTGFWSPLLSLTWGELMFLLAVVAAFVARTVLGLPRLGSDLECAPVQPSRRRGSSDALAWPYELFYPRPCRPSRDPSISVAVRPPARRFLFYFFFFFTLIFLFEF